MSGNGRSRRRAPAPRTGWDHLAAWYDGWVGATGSRYHRAIAIPTTLELLDVRPGERVLDVGCGQGVLASHVRRAGADYVGIDVSPRMVDLARRRHGREGRFVVGDARALASAPVIRPGSFDAASFLLSAQDMDDLDGVIGSVANVLRASSRIVLFLTHPAFRSPRHSGWGHDPTRGITFRRVDSYLTPMAVPLAGRAGAGPSTSFHRPLSAYVNALAGQGFAVDMMREIPDLPGRGGNAEIPLFVAIRAFRRVTNDPRAGAKVRS